MQYNIFTKQKIQKFLLKKRGKKNEKNFLGLLIIATLITVLSSCSLFSTNTPDPSCDEHNFVDWVCTKCGENYYVYVGELSFTSNGDGAFAICSGDHVASNFSSMYFINSCDQNIPLWQYERRSLLFFCAVWG